MSVDPTSEQWFKSTHSQGGADCVEVAFFTNGKVGVRDSKNPTGPALIFAADEWATFAACVGSGRLQRR